MKIRIAIIILVLALLGGAYVFLADGPKTPSGGYPPAGDIQNLKIN